MKWMFNNQIIDEEELIISANDHGFLYGVGLFETFRVYSNHPFLFEQHISRLETGLAILGIDVKYNMESLRNQLDKLLKINGINDAYVRLTVSAGSAPLGLPTEKYHNPAYLWQIKQLNSFSGESLSFKNAIILKQRRNTPEADIRLKSLNFLNNVLAKQEIMNLENTEGFFLSQQGYIAEGIVSNIFFIKDGILYTPSTKLGILDGITRKFVINLAQKNGIRVIEGTYLPKDLYKSDEIFITNSIQGISSIERLDNLTIQFRENGITNFLYNELHNSIESLIADERS